MICGTASRPLSGVAMKRLVSSGWLCCSAHPDLSPDLGIANRWAERFKILALSLLALAGQWTRLVPDLSLQIMSLTFAIPAASVFQFGFRRSPDQTRPILREPNAVLDDSQIQGPHAQRPGRSLVANAVKRLPGNGALWRQS